MTAGDFLVFITKVSGSGTFSGEGYVGIPYLNNAQVAVTFSNITVNTDNQLISGYFETQYDAVNNDLLMDVDKTLTGGKGVGDIRSGYSYRWYKKTGGTFAELPFEYNQTLNKEGEASYKSLSGNALITINNLYMGDYYFNLRDQNGCQAALPGGYDVKFTITQPDAPLKIEPGEHKHASGFGRSDGYASYRIQGGTPNSTAPLSYNVRWKNQQGAILTPVNAVINGVFVTRIENIPKGIYTLEVMDRHYSAGMQNACYATAATAITEPDLLTAEVIRTVSIDCHGKATGELAARVKGGVPYTATSVLFHLVEPPLLVTGQIATQNVTCHGSNNGFIHLDVSGGTGGYRLFYKRNDTNEAYQEHPVRSNGYSFHLDHLFAGVYSVYVLDGNGCYALMDGNLSEGEKDITITQPEKPLEAKLYQLKNTSGFGRSDGAVACRIEGGTPNQLAPLSYHVSWFDDQGNSLIPTDTLIDGYFITRIKGLPQGTYTLEVRDKNYVAGVQNACFFVKSIEIIEPEPLTVDLINTATVDCFGETTGEFEARVRGGVPYIGPDVIPYTFRWYKVENGTDSLLDNRPDSILSNLGTDFYKVYIEDGSDPVNTVESPVFHITEPPQLVTSLSTRNIACYGMNDGFIHLSVSGGTGGYRLFYKRDGVNEDYREHPALADGHTFRLDSLFSNVYSIYILDDNDCYAAIEGDDIRIIHLTQPDGPLDVSSVSLRHVSGFGKKNGSIEAVIEGGTILDDSTYTVTWRNRKGEPLTDTAFTAYGRYVSSINELDAGEYTIRITDKNYMTADSGMEATCFYTKTFTVTEPEELAGRVEETQVISCHGLSDGQLAVHVEGGVVYPPDSSGNSLNRLPYKHVWYKETSGEYRILPNETDRILENRSAGNYRVEITDYSWLANKITLNYTLVQPDPLQAVATDTAVTCGQTVDISVSVSGGTPPYYYEWSTGDNTPRISDVVAGKYAVFITDSRGCRTFATAVVTAPSDLKIEGALTDPLCFQGTNGSIELNITGGEPPYRYQWNTGATSKNLNHVPAGNYSVIVSDQGNCSLFQSFTLSEPAPISVDIGEDRTLCAGQSHEIAPVVEDPNTIFDWRGPEGFHSTDARVVVNKEGTYRLTITDSNGCQASDEMDVTVKNLKISSEMVVASQAFAGDTVVVVNISDPVPEAMEWIIKASDSLRIVESSDHQVAVVFNYPGHYLIGLRTHVEDCFLDNLKAVTVINPGDRPVDFFGESVIRNFIVSPTLNNGTFQVDVALTKEISIRLRIISLGSGLIISDTKYHGMKDYSIPCRMTIPAGVYAVMLETAAGHMVVKMITK